MAGIYGPQDAFVESLQIVHPQATIGLSYSPATGLEQLAADREFIGIQIKQLETEIGTLEKTVETNVTSLLIQAVELEKIIELNRQLITSAEEKASEEAKLYNQGQGNLFLQFALYRLCEMNLNGAIDGAEQVELYEKVLKLAKDLVAAEKELENAKRKTLEIELKKAKYED